MRYIHIGLIVGVLCFLVGCSSDKDKEQPQTEVNKEVETLKHEKKELEILLEKERQKTTVNIPSNEKDIEKKDLVSLETLFSDFLKAEFKKDDEALKGLTTTNLYTILVDKAGGDGESSLFQHTVKNIEIYQAEQTDDTTASLVGKITVQTQVGEHAPNEYQQLVECTAVKNSEGIFQVDTQKLSTLAP